MIKDLNSYSIGLKMANLAFDITVKKWIKIEYARRRDELKSSGSVLQYVCKINNINKKNAKWI